MDTNPQIIGFHMALGVQVMKLDQLETRHFRDGLYVAPELHRLGVSPVDAERIAGNVVLSLAYIALGRVS